MNAQASRLLSAVGGPRCLDFFARSSAMNPSSIFEVDPDNPGTLPKVRTRLMAAVYGCCPHVGLVTLELADLDSEACGHGTISIVKNKHGKPTSWTYCSAGENQVEEEFDIGSGVRVPDGDLFGVAFVYDPTNQDHLNALDRLTDEFQGGELKH